MTISTITPPFETQLLLEIAERFGTPSYVYSERTVRQKISLLRSSLVGIPSHLHYAMKANSTPRLLALMRDEGLGIDAVSPAELELALRTGFDPSNILFSANNMTDEEMHFAVNSGVLLNVGELSRLERFGRAYPGSDVCVRINPQVGAGHHEHVITAGSRSKFGIPAELGDEVRAVLEACNLNLIGLHQHIGSGILETRVLWDAISVLLDVARGFPKLRFLNVGGGLGVPYREHEAPIDLVSFADLVVKPLQLFLRQHPSEDLEVWFEPGRFFVAESGVLLGRVNTVKRNAERTFVGIDSGMNHLVRPAMYDAYHAIENLSNPDGEAETVDLVGNICETGDFLARDRSLQRVREGDVIAVRDTGAYGISMASVYNLRSLPAEIWISESGEIEQIRSRMSPGEMIDWMYGI